MPFCRCGEHGNRDAGAPCDPGWASSALAVVIVAIAVVAAGGEGDGSHKGGSRAATVAALAGIPQSGIALGSPDAPVTMVEFADLQCPFCAEYQRVFFRRSWNATSAPASCASSCGCSASSEDSDRLARVAAAAAAQNRMWQFVTLAYQRQGGELRLRDRTTSSKSSPPTRA